MSILLSFRLGAELFLIPLEAVERIVQIAAVRPVPGAPPELIGLLTVHGSAVPALDIRLQLGLTVSPPNLHDQLILLRSRLRRAALLVEETLELVTLDTLQPSAELLPASLEGALPWIAGAVQHEGRSQLLLNVDALLDFAAMDAPALLNSDPKSLTNGL